MTLLILALGFALVLAGLIALVVTLARAEARPAPAPWQVEQALGQVRPEVLRLIFARQKIQAVKVVRDATGLRLKEAKDIVDAIAAGQPTDRPGERR